MLLPSKTLLFPPRRIAGAISKILKNLYPQITRSKYHIVIPEGSLQLLDTAATTTAKILTE